MARFPGFVEAAISTKVALWSKWQVDTIGRLQDRKVSGDTWDSGRDGSLP